VRDETEREKGTRREGTARGEPRAAAQIARRAVAALGGWTLALPSLYMGFITFLSAQPGGKDGLLGGSFDPGPWLGNLLHVPLYAVLGLLWKLALETRRVSARRSTVLTVLLVTLFGIADEVHQAFVPGRTASSLDAALDVAGALLACLIWPRLRALFFFPDSPGPPERGDRNDRNDRRGPNDQNRPLASP
jgi:hypothetical protein